MLLKTGKEYQPASVADLVSPAPAGTRASAFPAHEPAEHALHEHILFQQLQEKVRAGQLVSQRLLVPETVDLPASQAALVLEQRQALMELGLEVESFGGGTVKVSSYPAVLGKRSPR